MRAKGVKGKVVVVEYRRNWMLSGYIQEDEENKRKLSFYGQK